MTALEGALAAALGVLFWQLVLALAQKIRERLRSRKDPRI